MAEHNLEGYEYAVPIPNTKLAARYRVVLYHRAYHHELVDQFSGIECSSADGRATLARFEPDFSATL